MTQPIHKGWSATTYINPYVGLGSRPAPAPFGWSDAPATAQAPRGWSVEQSEHGVAIAQAGGAGQFQPQPVNADLQGIPVFASDPVRSADVAVIVAAYNNGPFLRECLVSITQQTCRPTQIVYVDDGSTDDSVKIAQSVDGVRVVSQPHRGVVAARNLGLQVTESEYVLHVDGDDVLPPNYLHECLQAIVSRPTCPFVFTSAQAFGLTCQHWRVSDWDRDRLWYRNFVHTSALYRRKIVERVGGWLEGSGTCWDWHLALRASRHGEPIALPATHLLYRQHANSWSHVNNEKYAGPEYASIFGAIRRQCARKAVVTILSGRLPELFPKWLYSVARTIDQAGETFKLIVLDNAPARLTGYALGTMAEYASQFEDIVYRVIPPAPKAQSDLARRQAVSTLLADASNQAIELAGDTEIVWFVEDDILVPANACEDLLTLLTDGSERPLSAVAGIYRNRHTPEHYVAHRWVGRPDPRQVNTLTALPVEPIAVDMTGTGCLMAFRPMARHAFEPLAHGVSAHDWAWCLRLLESGSPVQLHPGVVCRHYQTERKYV